MLALTILKRMTNSIKEREILKVSDIVYKWNYDIYFMIFNDINYVSNYGVLYIIF